MEVGKFLVQESGSQVGLKRDLVESEYAAVRLKRYETSGLVPRVRVV